MDVPEPYFIGFAYFGEFGEHPQYHVARMVGDHFVTACGMNTIMKSKGEPDMVRDKEPVKGGKWTICPVCKRQWKKKKGEFKFAKTKRTSPDR